MSRTEHWHLSDDVLTVEVGDDGKVSVNYDALASLFEYLGLKREPNTEIG